MSPAPIIGGVILSGGRGTRNGGKDTGLLNYEGRMLIEHVIDRFAPQVDAMCINANRNLERYQGLGYPVISDPLPDDAGPLAGMLAGLEHAITEYVAFAPCNAPDLPTDQVARLFTALKEATGVAAIAHDGERVHPLHAVLKRDCRESLRAFLDSGERQPELWMQQIGAIEVDFRDQPDAFRSINDPHTLTGE